MSLKKLGEIGSTKDRAYTLRQDDFGAVTQERFARQRREQSEHRLPVLGLDPKCDHSAGDWYGCPEPVQFSQMA
jgi:hypothetical protein